MQIEQYHRSQISQGAGNVPYSQPNTYAGTEELGRTLTNIGFAAADQILKAQYYNERAKIQLAVDTEFQQYQESLDQNDTTNWVPDLEKRQEIYPDLVKVKSARLKAELPGMIEEWKLRQRSSLVSYQRVVDARNIGREHYAIRNSSIERLATLPPDTTDFESSTEEYLKTLYGLEWADDDKPKTFDNLTEAKDWNNTAFVSEKARRAEARAYLEDLKQARTKYVTEQDEAGREELYRNLIPEALAMKTEDEAIDFMRVKGLELGIKKEDINFASSVVSADFNRAEAQVKEQEEKRVKEAESDLAKRVYADTNKSTAQQVYEADLPRTERDNLLSMIKQRDKDIIDEKRLDTSPLIRTRFNLIRRDVQAGKIKVEKAVEMYLGIQKDIDPKEHKANIDALFAAGEQSKDPHQRQMATILSGRERKLRDSIEAVQSPYLRLDEQDYLKDLANEAVNEFNDRFIGVDEFVPSDVDAVVEELKTKYTLSRSALRTAIAQKKLIADNTFKQQVIDVQNIVKELLKQGKVNQANAVIEHAIKIGLAKANGEPAIGDGDDDQKKKDAEELKGFFDSLKENL